MERRLCPLHFLDGLPELDPVHQQDGVEEQRD